MEIKINVGIGFAVTEKRLLKLGFTPKDFEYMGKTKKVYVMGRNQGDCGEFNDTITYDPEEKEISVFYGAMIPFYDKTEVKSTIDIKRFLKGRDVKNHEIPYREKYGDVKDDGNRGFDVVLVTPGLARINIMKLLKEELNLSLQECKDFVNNTPKVIKTCFTANDAEKLKRKFEDLGAYIELK